MILIISQNKCLFFSKYGRIKHLPEYRYFILHPIIQLFRRKTTFKYESSKMHAVWFIYMSGCISFIWWLLSRCCMRLCYYTVYRSCNLSNPLETPSPPIQSVRRFRISHLFSKFICLQYFSFAEILWVPPYFVGRIKISNPIDMHT